MFGQFRRKETIQDRYTILLRRLKRLLKKRCWCHYHNAHEAHGKTIGGHDWKKRGLLPNIYTVILKRLSVLSCWQNSRKRFEKMDVLTWLWVWLLREGLDLPEVELIGILDADKEGFLRSETSLIQTIGRAAEMCLGASFCMQIPWRVQWNGQLVRQIVVVRFRLRRRPNTALPETIHKKISDITDYMLREHGETVVELLALILREGKTSNSSFGAKGKRSQWRRESAWFWNSCNPSWRIIGTWTVVWKTKEEIKGITKTTWWWYTCPVIPL